MANISTAHGEYTFNLANVKASNEEKVAWVKELAKLTGDVYYETYFDDVESLTINNIENDKVIFLPFSGLGHWTYIENIQWFKTGWEELKELVLKMDGIKIDINYKEYEPGGMFVSKGSFTVEVKDGEVSIIECSYESEGLNEETFVNWGFGTVEYYRKMFGCNYSEEEQGA